VARRRGTFDNGGVAELPTGTVTLLFSDIEGSTELLRHFHDRYPALLADHNRLLREVFAANGGMEVSTQGDSFFVAFRRAKDAVRAAVAARSALAKHEWPEGIALKIRIGIHTGEPEIADGTYIGLAVNQTARVMAAGRGGQILITDTTRGLVDDRDLPYTKLRDVGELRLKDFVEPKRVFHVDDEPEGSAPSPARRRSGPKLGDRRLIVAAATVAAAAAAVLVWQLLPNSASGTAYTRQVDALLDESAGTLRQLNSAIAAADVPGLRAVVDTRRRQVKTAKVWPVPVDAKETNGRLVAALQASLSADTGFLSRYAGGSVTDAELQTRNAAATVAKRAFVSAYNALRASLGLDALPATISF
jgi:class 3 adenylate cyclase